MILTFLFLAAVTLRPAAPAVGDLVTIEFAGPVVLDAPEGYEVVAQEGRRVVVRTFEPRPFEVRGTIGGRPFEPVRVPVRSVLRPDDDMKPAPLVPPRPVPWPRAAWISIGVAAGAAALAWLAAFGLARRAMAPPLPAGSPDEVFRLAVTALRTARERVLRWARLADATRAYLAATRHELGAELTTTELLPRLGASDGVVETILRQGDLEKFSRHGAEPRDFDEVAERALLLAAPRGEEESP